MGTSYIIMISLNYYSTKMLFKRALGTFKTYLRGFVRVLSVTRFAGFDSTTTRVIFDELEQKFITHCTYVCI